MVYSLAIQPDGKVVLGGNFSSLGGQAHNNFARVDGDGSLDAAFTADAAMDWEDFEHLIREMFAKEFTHGGGGVKITRASRDGGVDAVPFGPDPAQAGTSERGRSVHREA